MIKFSVVIPLYNKQNYIAATISSVLSQTYRDFEIIVINDYSTDSSLEVVKNIQDSRLTIINHEINKGLSASRNTGIKASIAKYVAFLDADDIWKPHFLKKIAELIEDYPEADLFATKYQEIYTGNLIIEHNFNVKTGIVDNFFEQNLNQSIYYPSCLCVNKSIFDTIGFYNENITYGEDIDFNIRAHLAFQLAYYDKPMVEYTMHSENQITQSSISNKVITDFDKYEQENAGNYSLKKYLDFHRYALAKQYKISGNGDKFKSMISRLDLKNLNYKQRLLLHSPVFILKLIKEVKSVLIKAGLNPTSY